MHTSQTLIEMNFFLHTAEKVVEDEGVELQEVQQGGATRDTA